MTGSGDLRYNETESLEDTMQSHAWSGPAFAPLEPGDPPLIGGYRVLARLGTGAPGRAYLATTQSGRRLAITIVASGPAGAPGFRRRFGELIAAAQRIQSPHIAPVVDAHADGPRPWAATAHVPGPSLAEAVARLGPMPDATVRALLAGTAEALHAAHTGGVVHHGLKPSAVLLAEDGPRVTGFGLPRDGDADGDGNPAVDVFALGAVVLYAATGRTVREDPDLEGCPEDLRDLIGRCLAEDPADRPRPHEILDELGADDAVPAQGWLPPDVIRRLPAYSAAPPGPVPSPLPAPPAAPRARLAPPTPEDGPPTLPAGAHARTAVRPVPYPPPPGPAPAGPNPPVGPPATGISPALLLGLGAGACVVGILLIVAVLLFAAG
ncbi:serine/threonine-protein kinase [Actinomadura xylanilytica]|nr:serine/threonine-protein kinase [Actinomadura xylanilytica]